jgi:hypothetical protein
MGQVKLQTRSGTNEYHGALFYSNFNQVERTELVSNLAARFAVHEPAPFGAAASAVR